MFFSHGHERSVFPQRRIKKAKPKATRIKLLQSLVDRFRLYAVVKQVCYVDAFRPVVGDYSR
jgi:hypothetical protein